MRLMVSALSVGLLLCAFGCQWDGSHWGPNYETVAVDPQRDTESARRANARGVEALQAGYLDAAEKELKAALVADTFFGPAHNNLGTVYFRQKKFYLAAWEFQYAANLMPNKAEPRNSLGLVYESVGRLEDAAKFYEDALTLDSGAIEIAGNLARLYVRDNRKDARTRQLLSEVALKDSRPEWAAWAKDQLMALGAPESQAPAPAAPGHTP